MVARLRDPVLWLALLAGCAEVAPEEPLPPLAIWPRLDTRLEAAPGEQPARAVRVYVRIKPSDGVPLEIVPSAERGSAVLDLTVRWEDFRGDGPNASGRSVASKLCSSSGVFRSRQASSTAMAFAAAPRPTSQTTNGPLSCFARSTRRD